MTRSLLSRSALVVCVLAALIAVPTASARLDGSARLHMVWPAQGTLTARFGELRGSGRHDGIDIGMLRTLQLRAVGSAVVRQVGYAAGYEGYGQIVLLELPRGYTALYAHLSRVSVRPGQQLRAGETLGLAGCTGNCSGTHLHFELRRRGVSLNPLPFLG
jgi:murein DD-endopeptidase MepM/ murein hydrolase activator NlpD